MDIKGFGSLSIVREIIRPGLGYLGYKEGAKFSKTPGSVRMMPSPMPGQHNEQQIYADWLRFSAEKIRSLEAEEII